MNQATSQPDMKKGEEVFDLVMERISGVLTAMDLETIEILNEQDDEQGHLVYNFLKAKVPNFEEIMQEEMDAYSAKHS